MIQEEQPKLIDQCISKLGKERRERILEIKSLIENHGVYNFNRTELANKMKVSRMTVNRDTQYVLDHIKIIDSEEIMFEGNRAFKKIIQKSWEKMEKSKQERNQQEWAKVLIKAIAAQTKFLEAYGIKPKIADPIIFEERSVSAQIVDAALREIEVIESEEESA